MKIFLTILCLFVCLPASASDCKVIKIVDGDTVYLDFNKNGAAEPEERVRLNGIDAFETHPSGHLTRQMNNLGMTKLEILTLGYMGKEFAKQELLNKVVSAEYTAEAANDKYGRPLLSIKYDNGKSYEKEILKSGLALVYRKSNLAKSYLKYENIKKIKMNSKKYNEYNLMYYSYKTKQFYPIDSNEAFNTENILINVLSE